METSDDAMDAVTSWENLTGPAIGDLLAADPDHVALIPVGATEQHGPHLPTATDTIIAQAICDRVSAATGALVLPAISIGVSRWHGTQFPGTLSLTPDTLRAIVEAYAEWASHSGIRRILLVNGHVGNTAVLRVAIDDIRCSRPDLYIGLREWWTTDPTVAAEVSADAADWHGNRAETSLMYVLAPHLVDQEAASGADDPDRTADLVFSHPAGHVTRNGVTGRPSEASAALGRTLLARVVGALVQTVERGRLESPPLAGATAPPSTSYPAQPPPPRPVRAVRPSGTP
ncbi:creatininase family protein [Streptomyces sp. NPDC006365]|uniref:creatininase family protein n=1 Tax=Streptomyces sp. NPDC006365 TaxID=3364744 RepID=UPI00369ECAED